MGLTLVGENLHKTYRSGSKEVRAVNGVSLEIKIAKTTAIVGPSGAGKSTLLHLLGGLDKPTSGKVLLNGRDINITQIEAGLAWHYKKYATEQSPEDRQRYARAEEQAHAARIGLWQDGSPVPPWAYRKAKKP